MSHLRFHRPARGMTLTESLIAISIMALFSIGSLSAIPIVHYKRNITKLRTNAILSLENNIELLRSVGYDDLKDKLQWNGVADNDIDDVWEYDPVAGGELGQSVILRRGFEVPAGGEGGTEAWQEIEDYAVVARQTCSLVAAGTEEARTEKFLRVSLTVEWDFRERRFQESLYTLIEH